MVAAPPPAPAAVKPSTVRETICRPPAMLPSLSLPVSGTPPDAGGGYMPGGPTPPPANDNFVVAGILPTPLPPKSSTPDEIRALTEYAAGREANRLVPPPAADPEPKADTAPPPSAESAVKTSSDVKVMEVGAKRDDMGARTEWQGGSTTDRRTGTTTPHADNGYRSETDWAGKFEELDVTIAEITAKAEVEGAVAQGSFGSEESFGSGWGSALGANAGAEARAAITAEGIDIGASAQAGAHALKGRVETAKDGLTSGGIEGSALSAEAKAEGSVVISPEQVTLKGKRGAEVMLVEASGDGEITITPYRFWGATGAPTASFIYGLLSDEELDANMSESWDIGVIIGADASAGLGLAASASGEVSAGTNTTKAKGNVKVGPFGLGGTLGFKY